MENNTIKVKTVINEFGQTCQIIEETRRLYCYNNKAKKITYNAEIIENGKPSGFWTNYEEAGTVDDISERLQTWNNTIRFTYAKAVGFNSPKNDPDGEKWKKVIEYVKNHENEIFTKTGDFRKKMLIDPLKFLKELM